MIRNVTFRTVPVKILTWSGDEEELTQFAGEKFIRVEGDIAFCKLTRGDEIDVQTGDRIIQLPKPFPLIFLTNGYDWNQIFTDSVE